jgi:hypothetical protein
MMFSLVQPMDWDCLIVGLLLLGVVSWVIIIIIIVGISLVKVTIATITYCGIVIIFRMGKGMKSTAAFRYRGSIGIF